MELMTNMGKRMLAISKRLRANKDLERIANDAVPSMNRHQNHSAISVGKHAIPYCRKTGRLAAMERFH